MKITTDGLIIKEQNIGDKDRLITILSRHHGLIRAFVKNIVNIKTTKSLSTRLLCYSHFSLFKVRDTYIVDDAQSKELFINLRKDIVKMSLAQYFCEISAYFIGENMQSEMFLRTVLNALHMICKTDKKLSIIKGATELRLLGLSGYMPDLIYCNICNCYESEFMYFLPSSGIIVCTSCIDNSNKYINEKKLLISLGVTTALRHCIYSPFEKLYSFNLADESATVFENVCEQYMLTICDKHLQTLDFYNVIKN